MKIEVFSSAQGQGLAPFLREVEEQSALPSLCLLQLNCDIDPGPAVEWAQSREVELLGATSCQGAMSQDGHHFEAVAFCIFDDGGDYGSDTRLLGKDPFESAREATLSALSKAGRSGETPDLIWVSSTPGVEEMVLDGIESVVGSDTPIIGGSAADNTVAGNWFVFGSGRKHALGVSIAVLFPSVDISFAYQNGYEPTTHSGTVTRAKGRELYEIDGRPAADVVSDWTGGQVPTHQPDGERRSILSESSLWPLGRLTHEVSGVPYYLLVHPSEVGPPGVLHLFADVEEGEVLTQMSGSADGLATRAERVAALAKTAAPASEWSSSGALIVYCGGCMLCVQDKLDRVVDGLKDELPGVPFAGAFTFGEQGPILNSGNRHGNLMISCVLFGRSE